MELNSWQFNAVCDRARLLYKIKGIIIYNPRRFLIAGWPIGRHGADNDNEAKS